MIVHLFGAASSPGCSNFALKSAAEFLCRDFYVDDSLKLVLTAKEAVQLVHDVKEMCNHSGFNLHKFTSNSQKVLKEIPEADRTEDVKNPDFD